MPLVTLFDLSGIDLTREVVPISEFRRLVPHRHEFALVDGVVHFDPATLDAAGYHDAKPDGFWVRGHIPGDPIFPGALMVETAAQLSAFCYGHRFGADPNRFFGFGGIDKVKFRSIVRPNQRLIVLCKAMTLDRRYSRFAVQGICEGRSCFEGEVVGVAMPRAAAPATQRAQE